MAGAAAELPDGDDPYQEDQVALHPEIAPVMRENLVVPTLCRLNSDRPVGDLSRGKESDASRTRRNFYGALRRQVKRLAEIASISGQSTQFQIDLFLRVTGQFPGLRDRLPGIWQ